ncbi:MAG: helix-turn-helix transcriptional regulator [Proteobacteria bacterium]|nr:helix-turn-helix transcriptional regulator [Pseudomonadota bacterium]
MPTSDIQTLLPRLSIRQHEVALCILAGDTNAEIGAYLELSRSSVERHVAAVLKAVGARSKMELLEAEVTRLREGRAGLHQSLPANDNFGHACEPLRAACRGVPVW